ncbi:MAG TPA: hypothetical protein VMW24_10455 [Sedimentisphaerales bacterium]|nr:hypothetical protein [Sedimentisphaerales bacterium]
MAVPVAGRNPDQTHEQVKAELVAGVKRGLHTAAECGTGGLPNQWIKPQRSHISVVAVRLAQSRPKNVIPAVLSMAEPLTNFVCLQWSH